MNVSQWIDTAVQAGVNDISSISFSLSDEESELVKNNLLRKAVINAKSKADIAASALGLEVIVVKSIIIEGVDEIPPSPPQPFYAKETVGAAAPEDGPSTPIIAGEQQVTSNVNIAFFIG